MMNKTNHTTAESDDLYGRQLFNRCVPDVHLTEYGGVCPFQMTGTIQGWRFYLRSKYHGTTLEILNEHGDSLYESASSIPTADITTATTVFPSLVADLHRARFTYFFDCNDVDYTCDHGHLVTLDNHGAGGIIGIDGSTPEDAYRRLFEPEDTWLQEMGIDDWFTLMLERDPDLTPYNTDDRVFPEHDPVFRVR
jgi:hypothetical protein